MNSTSFFLDYAQRLSGVLTAINWRPVQDLAREMRRCWAGNNRVFICGNGGSAGNAIHLANDYLYGIAKKTGGGLRVEALSANPSVITCLANDLGYERIYAEQLAVQGQVGDLLIALSGSGNSANIVAALEQARAMGIASCAILGFSGGKSKSLADIVIHCPVDDMQIAEDLQLVIGHVCMQWLYQQGRG